MGLPACLCMSGHGRVKPNWPIHQYYCVFIIPEYNQIQYVDQSFVCLKNAAPAKGVSFHGHLGKLLSADLLWWLMTWFVDSRADAIQRNYGGACVQMRLSFSSLAPFFLYLVQWFDCGCCYALPSYLGLFHVLICKVQPHYWSLDLISLSIYYLHMYSSSGFQI